MSGVDGAIRIDARIDTSHIARDTRTVENALSGAADAAGALEHTAEQAGEGAGQALRDGLGQGAEDAGASVGGLLDKLQNMKLRLADVIGAAKNLATSSLGLAASVGGLVVSGVSTANQLNQAMNQFGVSTGKSQAELQKYEKTLKNIYKNNYGESFEDISNAMAEINKQMGEMSDEGLQTATESAFALRDTFGYEIPESVRAANAIMKNFGVDSEKAFQLIASGAQNGLDFSGELIDSINEYSGYFATAGMSADQMFQAFQLGTDNAAWNLDKIGDAIKEMTIRVIDGSDTTKAGLQAIGLNADQIAQQFANGGYAAQNAFQQIVSGLAGMQDPLQQNTAGVNLFGTMWEDLGASVVTQLGNISTQAYGTADALTQIKSMKYDDLSSVMEGLKRAFELAAEPLGEVLIPAIASVLDLVGGLAAAFGTTMETLAPALSPLSSAFQALREHADLAFSAIAGGAAGLGVAQILSNLGQLSAGVSGVSALLKQAGGAMLGTFGSLGAQLGILGGLIASFLAAAVQVGQAWDSMSQGEQVVAILGMIAIAAGIAAVAFAALTGGVAGAVATAAGLALGVAGVVATMSAVHKAGSRKSTGIQLGGGLSWANPVSAASVHVPRLARGAVIPPGGEFLAVLGDQKNGRNLEAPEGLIRQIVREESGPAGGGTETIVQVSFEGSLAQIGRVLEPHIRVSEQNKGTDLVR